MFPRAIAKLPGSVRSRPLSTHKTFYYWGAAPGQCRTQDSRRCYSTRQGPSAGVVPPLPGSNITTTASTSLHPSLATAVLSAGEKDVERQETPVWRRFASTAATALVEDPVREDEDARYPPAVGLRPETAPASTPMDLGCKAYYMARTIDIRTVRSRLYAGFPHRFEKHCVVIGPLDPNCFDGGYPKPRDPSESLGQVLRDLSNRKGRDMGGGAPGSGKLEEAERRPFVAPAPFTVDGPEYRPRAWDMWEPGGASRPEQRGGVGFARVRDTSNSYVVLFDYGSVVFLHFGQEQQEVHLHRQRDFLYEENKIPLNGVKTETHGVVLWSTLPEPARLEPDCTTLRELDVNHITIIGTVLGQTVALDHYGDLVDSMMSKFVAINSGVEKTGKFTAAQKKELFQLVARNNTVRTDVISKLGILERSEAAWKHQDYNYVWEGLREEFEMDSRLRKIESKLSMLQQNTNFFIEMLHNQKSTMLEWTIIVLIAAEIVVGVCDLMNFKPFAK